MKKKKLKLYGKVIKKHKGLEKTLYFITFLPLAPLALLNWIAEMIVKATESIAWVRQKAVYGMLRFFLKKELLEFAKENDKQWFEESDEDE